MSNNRSTNNHNSTIETISHFIESARNQGISDEMIYKLLKNKGWSTQDIDLAFTHAFEKIIGVTIPVPNQLRGESAKETFLYLLSFVTLGIWSQALGSVGFIAVNYLIDDPLDRSRWFSNLASNLARLIIVYPVYLLLMKVIFSNLAEQSQNYQSGIRKWLTYIALFITALIVIGDLVWFLTSLLTGSLTLGFLFKSIIVLLIAGSIFCYYLLWLRKEVITS
ncbi:DUF5671 domain-containing protein [Cyanothece sp. BG0011]|uniref:DUF5671 domain-containing protein n=1 Tax=Cyanothece sp. BG0011 TaxID=2082950 RepID=UPI000D1F4426|nr:DUF5671 domain-containing protein [Cyanothece sp. BG0011]